MAAVLVPVLLVALLVLLLYLCCSRKYTLNWWERNLLQQQGARDGDHGEEEDSEKRFINHMHGGSESSQCSSVITGNIVPKIAPPIPDISITVGHGSMTQIVTHKYVGFRSSATSSTSSSECDNTPNVTTETTPVGSAGTASSGGVYGGYYGGYGATYSGCGSVSSQQNKYKTHTTTVTKELPFYKLPPMGSRSSSPTGQGSPGANTNGNDDDEDTQGSTPDRIEGLGLFERSACRRYSQQLTDSLLGSVSPSGRVQRRYSMQQESTSTGSDFWVPPSMVEKKRANSLIPNLGLLQSSREGRNIYIFYLFTYSLYF